MQIQTIYSHRRVFSRLFRKSAQPPSTTRGTTPLAGAGAKQDPEEVLEQGLNELCEQMGWARDEIPEPVLALANRLVERWKECQEVFEAELAASDKSTERGREALAIALRVLDD